MASSLDLLFRAAILTFSANFCAEISYYDSAASLGGRAKLGT